MLWSATDGLQVPRWTLQLSARRPGIAGPLPKAPGHAQPHPLSPQPHPLIPVCHADIGMGRL